MCTGLLIISFIFLGEILIVFKLLDIGDNMLTALSVARDCDMIPDDAKIIAVEVLEPNSTPTFTYAQVFNRKVKEVHYDLNVCMYVKLFRSIAADIINYFVTIRNQLKKYRTLFSHQINPSFRIFFIRKIIFI